MKIKRLKPAFLLAASLLTACAKPIMYKLEPVLDEERCLVTQESITKQDDEVVSRQKELLATEAALNFTKECIRKNLKGEDIRANLKLEQNRLEAVMKLSAIRAGVNLGGEFDKVLNRKILEGLESKIAKVSGTMKKSVLESGHTPEEFYNADIAGLAEVFEKGEDEATRLQAARELLLIHRGKKYAAYSAASAAVEQELSVRGIPFEHLEIALGKEASSRLIGCRMIYKSWGKMVLGCD